MLALVDERFRIGSYIHDDSLPPHLYFVLGEEASAARGLVAAHTDLLCENCATGYSAALSPLFVRRHCTLVRAAPPAAPPVPHGWRFP